MSSRFDTVIVSGDPVHHEPCPRCRHVGTVVYNGNYWCTRCPWVMAEGGRPKRIIGAYLRQLKTDYLARGDARNVALMESYLEAIGMATAGDKTPVGAALKEEAVTDPTSLPPRRNGISLDADSIRIELDDATAEAYDLTPQQAALIQRLSDDEINRAVTQAADDDFWELYDVVRRRVIATLARTHAPGA